MEWIRVWRVDLRWDDRRHAPDGALTCEVQARTPTELRRVIDAARADPHIVAFPHRSMRILDGEPPDTCPSGHAYVRGWSVVQPWQGWTPCRSEACGGHHVLYCWHPGCPTPSRLDPELTYDCVIDHSRLTPPSGR